MFLKGTVVLTRESVGFSTETQNEILNTKKWT